MSTTNKPDHRTLPRRKRPPSGRDLEIFVARRTLGQSTLDLAKEHRLSPSRISQIVGRVEKWRANVRPQAQGELDHAERQRLERWLARERHQAIYDRAMQAYDNAPKELKTTRRGERDGKTFSEEISRQVPPPAAMLKLAQRVVEDMAEAAEQPAPAWRRDEAAEQAEDRRRMMSTLIRLRREAEQTGKVAMSCEHQRDNYSVLDTVERWFEALVGEKPEWPPAASHLAPGTPLAQLSAWFQEMRQEHARRGGGETADLETQSEAADVGWAMPTTAPTGAAGMVGTAHPTGMQPEIPSNPSNPSNANVDDSPQVQESVGWAVPTTPRSAVGRAHPTEASQVQEAEPVAAKSPVEDPRQMLAARIQARRRRRELEEEQRRAAEAAEEIAAAERRRLHMEKLEQWKIARRRGLPCMFEFDPADGPLPPRYYSIDGAECVTG